MINVSRLHRELLTAGIPVEGVSQDGRIDFLPEATPQQRTDAALILAAHDPAALSPDEARIKTIAQSAVGVALTDLTAAQVKALMACLLFRAGGVGLDGIVRPLEEWVFGQDVTVP